MRTHEMPDKNVTTYIENFTKEFSLEIVSVESEKTDEGETWDWTLRKPNASVFLKLSIDYPTYHTCITFRNELWRAQQKEPDYFAFNIYLRKIAKDEIGNAKILLACQEQDWKKNWAVEFDILKEHIRNGKVQSILDGTYWPIIYFDWDDYVEPAAADQIYEDQLKRFDAPDKEGKKPSWIRFLNFFKN